MICKWQTVPLSEVLELVIDHRGKTPNKLGFDGFHDSGYPVLSAKHVKTSGLVSMEAIRYANQAMYEKWMKVPLAEGDVVLTSEAPLGETFYIDGTVQYLLGQRVFGLRPRKHLIEPLYLLAWLSSAVGQKKLNERASGSTVQGIKQSELLKIEIELPPLAVQKVIAANQHAISKKISINQEINKAVDQLSKLIFKSWFVDFEPVKAKLSVLNAGGTQEEAVFAGMTSISGKTKDQLLELEISDHEQFSKLFELSSLFPSSMQNSNIGNIPDGWSIRSLTSMIDVIGGGTPKRSEDSYWGGDIGWFSVKDVPLLGDVFVLDTEEKITELGLKKSSTKLLPEGTTIITARGTVGKLALVGKPVCMNQSCYGVRGVGVGDYFNYFNLHQAVSTLLRNTHGAVFDTITTRTFDTYSFAFCGYELAEKFDALVAPLLNKIKNNVSQNKKLAEMRDTLLPKLLSGEIQVGNADSEEAA